jgi:hypothetical protein
MLEETSLLKDIVAVKPLEDYKLCLTFEDDVEGVVDIAELIEFTGIFEPLRDPAYFAQVTVNPDLGTICWKNGADLDPIVLYTKVRHLNPKAYLKIKDQLFIGETVNSLVEKVQSFEAAQNES